MPRSFISTSLAAILLLLVPGALGAAEPQETAPGKAQPGQPPGDQEPAQPGEIHVKADSYQQQEKGHMEARGTVDLRLSGMRILADKADVYEEPQADGTTRRRLVAEGNVVFVRGDERLAGDRVEMDDTGHGFFDNAVGYVEPGVFIEAKRVERVDDRTYRVEGGRFTACAQPNPRWKFSASRAKIEVDDKIIAQNTVFRIKGVPAFYLPWLYYPINHEGRTTGFLFPSLGYSSYKGFIAGTGFFWAMGRSVDQTFAADSYSKLGYGFGHELRWAEESPSRGSLRTYLFHLTPLPPTLDPSGEVIAEGREAANDYDIDWNALQMLPGKARATLSLRKFSNLLFQQRFQDSFNLATNRTERLSAAVEKDLKLAVLSAYADDSSTYFGTDYANVSGRLPGVSLRRFPRQIGWGGFVFGLQAGADRLRYGNQERVDSWSRWDVAPTLSRPFNISFLDFTPSVGYRYTHYGSSLGTRVVLDENGNPVLDENGNPTEEAGIVDAPVNRSFLETQVEMRGPTFSRVFDTPGILGGRMKHTIGPEVSWRYRTRVESANEIPKFDGSDYLFGTDEVNYALVQRFYSKRRGPGGKPQAWNFFEWRIMQTYYVQISEGQNNFDPNYSSSAFGPGYRPEHLSPISSRWRLRPTNQYSLDYQMEYDVNFQQLRRMSAYANVTTGLVALTAGWARSLRVSEDPAQRQVGSHTLRGNLAAELWPKRLHVEGSLDYDLLRDQLLQMRAQARYSIQCCGFSVEHTRYNWNQYVDSRWRFNVELAGIGSMGNFLGPDATGSRQGLGGYR